jgi:DNA (cytosine-5)-methyltransferase 1
VRAYYNEIDRYCCDWLQNLMDAGHITRGRIDDRSIADLSPDDVRGYERVHFFAGIAGWELALQMSEYAGPVWTGSCPCQPFSAAGKGKASGDERHLWPEWFRLIRAVQPPIIFGEQVEAAIGWGWLDLVHSDLEAEGYAVGAAVLPACSVGAPHIRQRLWFVAEPAGDGRKQGCRERDADNATTSFRRKGKPSGGIASSWTEHSKRSSLSSESASSSCGSSSELADSKSERNGEPRNTREAGKPNGWAGTVSSSADGIMGLAKREGLEGLTGDGNDWSEPRRNEAEPPRSVTAPGWADCIWLPCTDGKQRPTQPGIFPLAHGVPGRVAKLRAAGNAIVPQVAAEFIKASMT